GRLVDREIGCEGPQSVGISTDSCQRDYPAQRRLLAFHGAGSEVVRAVAAIALLAVDCRTLGRECRVDREGIGRWWELAQPARERLEARYVDSRRGRSGAESRAEVTFEDARVVAVPVERQPLPRRLIPDRREIGGTDQLLFGELVHREAIL